MTSPLNAFLVSRRHVLQGGAALSAAALAGRSAFAAPSKPLTFIGWQYHPEIVEQNVDTSRSSTTRMSPTSSSPASTIPCGDEADRRPARRHDVFRGGPYRALERAEWTRDFEGLPDIDAIKAAMFPVAVASCRCPTARSRGLPYYAGHNAFIYNEEHLSRASLQVPDSWDTLLDACRKLKKDGVSDAPYNSAWGQKWAELSWSLFSLLVRRGRAGLRRQERLRRRRLVPQGPAKCTVPSTRSNWSRRTS